MTRTGTCPVTPPPVSACPSPTIGADDFYADPARVRRNNETTLFWDDIENATSCALTGGGLNLSGLGISGSEETNPITAQTTFTLTCENGAGGPRASAQVTVGIIPEYEEI